MDSGQILIGENDIRDRGTVAVDGVTVTERLPFWPFTHATLLADLRAAGLEPADSTFTADAERYLVTARRP